jgi:hypothetical protein
LIWAVGVLRSRKRHQSPWSSPWTHEFECLGWLGHGLGNDDIRRTDVDFVRAAQHRYDARQTQLAAGFFLQVMSFEPRFDQYDLEMRAQNRDRETRKADTGSQVDKI